MSSNKRLDIINSLIEDTTDCVDVVKWSCGLRVERTERRKGSYVMLWLKMNICFNQWYTLGDVHKCGQHCYCVSYSILLTAFLLKLMQKKRILFLSTQSMTRFCFRLFMVSNSELIQDTNALHIIILAHTTSHMSSAHETGNSINLIRLLSVKAFSKHPQLQML